MYLSYRTYGTSRVGPHVLTSIRRSSAVAADSNVPCPVVLYHFFFVSAASAERAGLRQQHC